MGAEDGGSDSDSSSTNGDERRGNRINEGFEERRDDGSDIFTMDDMETDIPTPVATPFATRHPDYTVLTDVRLSMMGDAYGVPSLATLARSRFWYATCGGLAEATLREVVGVVYGTARRADIALRKIVGQRVAETIEVDDVRGRLMPVMKEHGDLGEDVLGYLYQNFQCSGDDYWVSWSPRIREHDAHCI